MRRLARLASRIGIPLLALCALGSAGCTTQEVVCDPSCPTGFKCTEAGCVAESPGPDVDLATATVDAAGGCVPECTGAARFCKDGKCLVCLTDDNCPVGQVCKPAGNVTSCVPGCVDDGRCGGGAMKCCNGGCIDTSKDASNCGACGMACGTQHSKVTCANSACVPGACDSGWGDCNADLADGCETNLRADVKNCGGCNTACSFKNAVSGCADTCYIAACLFGYDDCNGDDMDGCEVSVIADARNCGACGMACPARANAQTKCINATCALTSCNIGYDDCDRNPVNGCEVTLGTDAKNCGACGNACPQGQICVNGGCTCGNCNIPNAKTKCINNQCVFDGCAAGFADCDNNQGNGCEVNIGTDSKNCGGCGMACPGMQVCSQGSCMNCGNDCWGAAGCLTAMGKCIQFTCRAGNAGANFCNACKGWKEVSYDQWMNQGYCKDVIARYRQSDGANTKCGNAASCCGSSQACTGGDNAWHFWNAQQNANYFTGPVLGSMNDTNCTAWNNVDNSGYTRITVCEQ